MPAESSVWSRRDSWPPTQVRLNPSMSKASSDPRPLLEDIDDNPLTYFLTPGNDMGDVGYEDMVYDAGIEDSSQPRDIVRSVSPSSLEGLGNPKARAASPELDSDGLTTDEDDDEDYVRFSPGSPSRLASLRNIAIDGLRLRTMSPVHGRAADGLLSPASYPAARTRGRSSARTQRVGQARSMSARPRPGRLWREPSPDVWSIEEETEEEMMRSQTDGEGDGSGTGSNGATLKKTAARPKKRVRFLLPARE
ncbi:hypothetical protein HRG_009871 [Hirsutella rhossiliensis]|uniref:Uncharacterized protein n=1 Tax=Hirsutella rhossiliensis TaxID=111463 RepID=A0A9P8MRF2_9HYPO|nr:uncharacterized protein HRG_09871 [Hirsutella rhossiliensis]KAH0958826.1 hypothetical protein HRG_09871 [Hirsutella rhossiliensis]